VINIKKKRNLQEQCQHEITKVGFKRGFVVTFTFQEPTGTDRQQTETLFSSCFNVAQLRTTCSTA
jgi:hypothetical protein